jgi:diguanylate cyclase (GGDEF)-like protein
MASMRLSALLHDDDDPAEVALRQSAAATLYRQAPAVLTGAAALGVVTMIVIDLAAPGHASWTWLAVFLLLQAVRALDARRWRAAADAPPASTLLRRYGVGLLASALVWAAMPLLLPAAFPAGASAVAALGTVAFVAGTAVLLGPLRLWAVGHAAIALTPIALWLVARPGNSPTLIGVMALLAGMPAAFAAFALHRQAHGAALLEQVRQRQHDAESALRARVDELEAQLADARAETDRVHSGFAEHVDARTEALEARSRELARQAVTDALTGLPNRKAINEHLLELLDPAAADESLHRLALLFVDLDHFKEVNDLIGHLSGDAVLKVAAERLRETIPRGAFAARWGGDEFVVLLPGLPSSTARAEQQAKVVAEQIRAALSVPVRLEGHSVRIGCCVGIALAPDHGRTAEALVIAADQAVYSAKAEGSGRVRLYDAKLAEKASRHHRIAQALPAALDLGQLAVAYQPIVSADGEPSHAEALARWWHPQWGAVSPGEFIPVAEASGLIHAMGRWVLRQACLDAARWPGDHPPKVSVNVSAMQISSGRLVAQVREALAAAGLPAQRLAIEITESLPMGGRERVESTLAELREMGVSLVIDDFGTGYSSLSSLKRLPLSLVKVDHSFVRDIPGEGELLIKATVDVARCFGLDVVAEGVETHAQRSRLVALGVNYMQGYLFGRPMTHGEFVGWLRLRAGHDNVVVLRA